MKRRVPAAEYDDLVGDGMVGLVQASRRYDWRAGVAFRSYAARRIMGEMFDGIRRLGPLPRSDWRRVADADDDFEAPTVLSLSQQNQAGEELVERVPSQALSTDDEAVAHELVEGIMQLPAREAALLARHVLLGEDEADIAASLGVSPSRVSQIVVRARTRLRRRLGYERPRRGRRRSPD